MIVLICLVYINLNLDYIEFDLVSWYVVYGNYWVLGIR
jgi:hypothetical protein